MRIQIVKVYCLVLLSIFMAGTFYTTVITAMTYVKQETCLTNSIENSEKETSESNLNTNVLEEEIKHKSITKDWFTFTNHAVEVALYMINHDYRFFQYYIPSVPTPPPDHC